MGAGVSAPSGDKKKKAWAKLDNRTLPNASLMLTLYNRIHCACEGGGMCRHEVSDP